MVTPTKDGKVHADPHDAVSATAAAPAAQDTAAVGVDDYSLSRVPMHARYNWFTMAVQRFGMLSALGSFFLATVIGFGMSFWDAMLAVLLGSVLLEIVTVFTGIAGQREGLNTSLLSRWSGFGAWGSAIVGLVIAVSLVGWFGVQNSMLAAAFGQMFPGVPLWVWCMVGGLIVTLIVVYGMKWMNWVAYVAVPAFLIIVLWSFIKALTQHNVGELMSSAPTGQPITMAQGITLVAGGFIAGAIFTPDLSRFNRSTGDVIKQTVLGVTLGEFFVSVIGVLLAHTIKTVTPDSAGNVIGILQGGAGVLALVVVILSVLKVNDWNLYPSSLGVVNSIHGLTGKKLHRTWVAIVLGLLGSIASAVGIGQSAAFQGFLNIVGMFFPPIAAIMIVDYFLLKSHRAELDESREHGFRLPSTAPAIVPLAMGCWVAGFLVAWAMSTLKLPGFLQVINVPSLVALGVTFLLYWGLGSLGLAKPVGAIRTPQANER